MKSGFFTLQGRGVKHKEGLNDTTLATECGKNVDGDPAKGTNVVSNDQSFLVMNTSGNLIGGGFKVVKDGMEYGFVDPKVMKGVDEPVSTILKSFASLVTNEVVTYKTPNANLLKECMILVPMWVKFHDIPTVAFTAYKLSVMDTKLGNLIMLDSYTSS
ncbi:hypothetical protein Tco_1455012, partial [Tanacetum coccineum]